MSSERGVKAGKAYVEITTDQSKLVEGLKEAQKKIWRMGEALERNGRAILKIGAVSIAPFALGLKKLAAVDPQVAAELKQIADAFNQIFIALGKVVMDAIRPYIGSIVNACRMAALWIQSNRNLVLTILKVGVALMAVGTALIALGSVVKALSVVFMLFTSEIGLAIAAFAAIVGVLAYASGAFVGMGKTFKGVFDGVLAALMSGQIELAFEIMLKGCEIAIIHFVDKVENMIHNPNSIFGKLVKAAYYAIDPTAFLKGMLWKKNNIGGNAMNTAMKDLARLKRQIKPVNFTMSTANAAAQQITATKGTYAHLNAEAFTHLFGGLAVDDVQTQQLNTQKQIMQNTKRTYEKLTELEVG